MPSHLTRQVFRSLAANQPLVHRGCLRRQRYSTLFYASRVTRIRAIYNGFSISQLPQRRSFLNFNVFSKRQEAKEPDMDPGIEKMMELAKKERMRARLPPLEEVADAFRQFFLAKKRKEEEITDNQAQLALQSLRYCKSSEMVRQEGGVSTEPLLTATNLYIAARVVSFSEEPTRTHVELARELYESRDPKRSGGFTRRTFITYAQVLSRSGSALQARDLTFDLERWFGARAAKNKLSLLSDNEVQEEPTERSDSDELIAGDSLSNSNIGIISRGLSTALEGFVREDNGVEVQRTLALIEERGFSTNRNVATAMLNFCLKRNDHDGVKHWWATLRPQEMEPLDGADGAFDAYLDKVLKWCLANHELETGHKIVRDAMTGNPPKPWLDAILVWAAGTKKSVDEIDRMISVMEKSNEAAADPVKSRLPDIATINALLEFAISKNDPYMAERFVALGRDRKIEPDARTYVLQMNYRLSVDDVDGALIAYRNLQSMDLSSNEDVPTVNRLIVALCGTNRHDFDTIMNVAADLSDRRARFESETAIRLSILHLKRDEREDVLDLLNTHAFHYSSTERQSVRDALIKFCVDPKTPTSRAWQGYSILKAVFDEMPRSERTELMTSFFNRNRADMAVHVFQHMRMHTRDDTIPTIDTYVAAFLGLAHIRDLESLEVVHNLLKIDYNIDVSTFLNNALIIAYTACGEPREALGFWSDIVASREGPSYNSIHAALRACEKAPWGDVQAQRIWGLLRERGVEVDHALWASYAGSLAGNGDIELAIRTIEEAEEKGEVEVDFFVLGSLFNGTSGQTKQDSVEAWGKEKYPGEWKKLEGFGVDFDENRMRTLRIDRRVAP